MELKIGDKVKIKKWKDIDKSLYPNQSKNFLEMSKKYLKKLYKKNMIFTIDKVNGGTWKYQEEHCSSKGVDKHGCYHTLLSYFNEIEREKTVNLPDELFTF